MKTILLIVALTVGIHIQAQVAAGGANGQPGGRLLSSVVTERGRNYEVVQVTRQTTNAAGEVSLSSATIRCSKVV